jgi:5'-nucleotidase
MDILLTNDDGIYFDGLWALYRVFSVRHRVVVIAPDRERSAVGHAITLSRPLRTATVEVNGGFRGTAVNGTPADCVKLGIQELLDRRPDIVVAGINPGPNVGVNLNYSGTVAGAKEAALCGIAAIAVSIEASAGAHYDDAARFVRRLAERIHRQGLPAGTFLNVNIPAVAIKDASGVNISRQGLPILRDMFEKRVDPRERPYYWQGTDGQQFDGDLEVDGGALKENFITITPIKCDMTDYQTLETLKTWYLGDD